MTDTHSTLAEELFALQQHIRLLQDKEADIKAELIADLKKHGTRSVPLESGSSYVIAEKSTLKIVDEEKAEKWLDEHHCWKPDTTKAMSILKRELKMPKFFKRSVTEYITIKNRK